MVANPRRSDVAASDPLERELARVRGKWIQTIAAIARHRDNCNQIESRRLSRWSSAIAILKRRIQREHEDRQALQMATPTERQ